MNRQPFHRDIEERLVILEEALAVAHRTCEAYYRAELYRLKGGVLLSRFQSIVRDQEASNDSESPLAEAEASFIKSIRIAQQQKAKSWELRAATNLARLYQSQGDCEEARTILAEIHSQFTEGLETADRREARTLLAALS